MRSAWTSGAAGAAGGAGHRRGTRDQSRRRRRDVRGPLGPAARPGQSIEVERPHADRFEPVDVRQQRRRRIVRDDRPVGHQHQPIRTLGGGRLVLDEENGRAACPHRGEGGEHLGLAERVEIGRRLVEHQDRGLQRE